MKIGKFKFDSKNINKGNFRDIFPEFYLLSGTIENDLWHQNQNVYEHTVRVIFNLERLLDLDFLPNKARVKLKIYLNERIDHHLRKDLILISTFLHDMAKKDTRVIDASGKTSCPAHEVIGGTKVSNFSKRFELTHNEEEIVKKTVSQHALVYDFYHLRHKFTELSRIFELYSTVIGSCQVELVLLFYSDILGSDGNKGAPEEFNICEAIAQRHLKWLSTRV